MNCPHCQAWVMPDAMGDYDCDGTTVWIETEGTCPRCGKHWKWFEVYTFSNTTEIEEVP